MLVLSSACKYFPIDENITYSLGELAHVTSQPSCHQSGAELCWACSAARGIPREKREEISHRVVQGGLKMILCSFGCSELGSTSPRRN